MPIGLEWPDCFFDEPSVTHILWVDGVAFAMDETDLSIFEPHLEGNLVFQFLHEDQILHIEMELRKTGEQYQSIFRVLGAKKNPRSGKKINSHAGIFSGEPS